MEMFTVVLFLVPSFVFGLEQNVQCPSVRPEEIDIKALDGIWYISEMATGIPIEGNCSKLLFDHKADGSTDMILKWVKNNTLLSYNGSAMIVPNDPGKKLDVVFSDKKSMNFTVLTISYEHYALLYSCSNNVDGNSSNYELWKLSRSSKLKGKHASDMSNVLSNYNMSIGSLKAFSNTEQACFLQMESTII